MASHLGQSSSATSRRYAHLSSERLKRAVRETHHARELLERMQAGTCTSADVARLAADVLANPPPVIAAAQWYLREVGGQHEGSTAVELLGLLARAAVGGPEAEEEVS